MSIDRRADRHWVYRCFDADGRLIYVGSTADLFGRLTSHRATSWWSPTVAKVTAKVYPNGIAAREVERAAIRDELPRWNKSGKWGSRARWNQDDWHDWISLLLRGSNTGRPLAYPSPELRRACADYVALFQAQLPVHLHSAFVALEAADIERSTRQRDDTMRRRREIQREDELALARDKKKRKKGQSA